MATSGRIRTRAKFALLRRTRLRGWSGPVSARFVPAGDDETGCFFAYSVPRRVGKAVVRNRCRRRLRAIAADVASGLLEGSYLVSVESGAIDMDFGELSGHVKAALAQSCSVAR